jgi:hypothetical protein
VLVTMMEEAGIEIERLVVALGTKAKVQLAH